MVNLRVRQWRFRTQLLSVMVLLVAVPVITLGAVLYGSTRQHTLVQVEQDLQHHTQTLIEQARIVHQLGLEKLDADLATAQYILAEGGTISLDEQNRRTLTITNQISQQTTAVDVPMLTIDGQPLWESHALVDRMKFSSQLTATIFQYLPEGLLRVSTNVLNQDQSRANREFNHILLALARMQQQLQDMVGQIAQAAHSMSATSQELGASVQTVMLTVEQVVTNIAEITQGAQETHQLAQQGEQAARQAEIRNAGYSPKFGGVFPGHRQFRL
ncbi:hypothetical protein GFS31_05120 [Leptolyngbya sp. BL0902]|uniref:Cache 3/Cache 2 fusion domain-containing protein n=1 Tax=Leptolyngbya sp. BL0902 TaxID=1115757 RepID=UPI0018E8F98F|nr:Cache 3/Cache 2 fusion domain-containing protein [Leptolyngbya sp. BL0902]QQE63841.1 hypothetical protein GFS31_05120 [Leptolyngbya sp. BL0902]